jgi:glycosyltransferase involved in cell wall biosynthesis
LLDNAKAIGATKSKLRRENIDVLHLCSSASFGLIKDYIVLNMARRKRIKTIIHFHFGRIPEICKLNNWEWKLLLRVVSKADMILVMDSKSYDTLKLYGIDRVKYLPNPLSIDIIKQIEKSRAYIDRVSNKVSFVGHVTQKKGIYELVEACRSINGLDLHIIGKVSPEVKNKMIELAGDDFSIIFKGEIPHNKVIEELLSTKVFVLPSYTEGFPNVILESMACGCAIVASSVGAIPEMLGIGGKNPCGIICNVKDVDSLRTNIQALLADEKLSSEYGSRAKKRVHNMYAMPIVWQQLKNIWAEL